MSAYSPESKSDSFMLDGMIREEGKTGRGSERGQERKGEIDKMGKIKETGTR